MTLNCPTITTYCSQKRNLLAFSAGIDSSALFFLLLKNSICFDIAIVDYGIRTQSKEEIMHAKTLADKYNLTCHTIKAPLFQSHFEFNARKFRYHFFEKLIAKYHYDNLLTAHQLNDHLEWMLMRLTKGAGLSELVGLEAVSQREGYTLIHPLLSYTKTELIAYLESNRYPYFTDESNMNEQYERNYFRKHFSDPLISQYAEGIKRSFNYLKKDKVLLEKNFETIYQAKELRILKVYNLQFKSKVADITLKQLGYVLSSSQRREIEREKSLVIGGKWVIELADNLLYIAPYLKKNMPKVFKEMCRIKKIPVKIRPYLYYEKINMDNL
ncbi:MAG: tRNA lysidine(34) synthetase TilS [Sulfurovum sp.]|nr:tRNA lysidine(34) synthetase TilS [Sulfurovum sp.]MCB4750770.1 tRNA lysidine(34) synthetase TilS [Sulfurovum sp.]MCB4753126.1 tRNA lysidine(34) synthetase TilS [Sulfurovum sp.]MCB4754849.1 tRNA lysidine(34) synthetase TilS [Sulfurovum sp.]MCB4757945.1 tRNA lysidine(34) synthetase TilS [Sulfurovum sp.]